MYPGVEMVDHRPFDASSFPLVYSVAAHPATTSRDQDTDADTDTDGETDTADDGILSKGGGGVGTCTAPPADATRASGGYVVVLPGESAPPVAISSFVSIMKTLECAQYAVDAGSGYEGMAAFGACVAAPDDEYVIGGQSVTLNDLVVVGEAAAATAEAQQASGTAEGAGGTRRVGSRKRRIDAC